MDKEQNKEEIRYRCSWCNYVMDENRKILNKEERDKYEDVYLPRRYCKECWDYIQWENDTYGFN